MCYLIYSQEIGFGFSKLWREDIFGHLKMAVERKKWPENSGKVELWVIRNTYLQRNRWSRTLEKFLCLIFNLFFVLIWALISAFHHIPAINKLSKCYCYRLSELKLMKNKHMYRREEKEVRSGQVIIETRSGNKYQGWEV